MSIREFISKHVLITGLIIVAILLIVGASFCCKDDYWLLLWTNFVCINWYFLLLALGGLLLFSMQTIIPSKWFDPLKLQSLQTAGVLRFLIFSFLLVLASAHFFIDRIVESSFHTIWFHPIFLTLRAVVILFVFYTYHYQLLRKFRNQNEQSQKHKAIEFVIVLLLGFSLFSWDWLMSIQLDYHSALFSFYLLVSALLLICGFILVKNHQNNQLHSFSNDLGRLTMAISLIWFYVFFSQFLIAWYTSIPSEIAYYQLIFQWNFLPFLIISVLGNFLLPWLILLSKNNRKSTSKLYYVGLLILIAKWFEIYLLIAPSVLKAQTYYPIMEVGFIILAAIGIGYILKQKTLIK